MSIKLRFEKGSLMTQVILQDEALPELMAIVSKYQSDEAAPPPTLPLSVISSAPALPPADDAPTAARQWLAQHGASEVLNKIKWETYPEKILLLGALHEAAGGGEGWKSSDMTARFSEAKEPQPANFPRDIVKAIKGGWITAITPRTYKITRTGWNRISEGITAAESL